MQSRQERFGEPLQARPISRHVAGRNKSESLRSIDHEHIFVGRYRASARLPFWFRAEASQKAKNLWRKRATVAPYFEKIRRKRATVARYSMFYRFLCNVLQRDGVQPGPDLVFGLCCYVPFHNSWYGL